MSNIKECPSCGNVNETGTRRCVYCGTANTNFVQEQNSVRGFIDEIKHVVNPNGSKDKDRDNINDGKPEANNTEFNIAIFIILLIVFWPLAIIYLVIKKAK